AGNRAELDRVTCRCKHDWYDRRCLLCRRDCCACGCDNDIYFEADELGHDFNVAPPTSLREAILDRDVVTFDPAKFAKSPHKSGDPLTIHRAVMDAQSVQDSAFVKARGGRCKLFFTDQPVTFDRSQLTFGKVF